MSRLLRAPSVASRIRPTDCVRGLLAALPHVETTFFGCLDVNSGKEQLRQQQLQQQGARTGQAPSAARSEAERLPSEGGGLMGVRLDLTAVL